MENVYLFIIWHKALWCSKKIKKDLSKSFEIISDFMLTWDKDKFGDNLLAFYGHKLGSVAEKIFPCGNGPFEIILVKDNNPIFEKKQLFHGEETVNINVFNKKDLYRKWTAGGHRIHCSDTDKETIHDLSVLFGLDFQNICKTNRDIKINTIGIEGFKNLDEFKKCLELYGDNKTMIVNDEINIFCKCRFDIEKYLYLKSNQINIDNKIYKVFIYGELDGDLPDDSFNLFFENDTLANLIISNKQNYNSFLINRDYLSDDIKDYFEENGLNSKFDSRSTERYTKGYSSKEKIVDYLKIIKAILKSVLR